MAISSMQQPRQMYGLGSFVKKFTKPLKKIVKSPLGKAALLGAGAYFAPTLFGGTAGFGKGSTIGNYFRSGAGKGIGRACAIALAEAGANLVIISRTQKDLNEVIFSMLLSFIK